MMSMCYPLQTWGLALIVLFSIAIKICDNLMLFFIFVSLIFNHLLDLTSAHIVCFLLSLSFDDDDNLNVFYSSKIKNVLDQIMMINMVRLERSRE